MKRKLCSLLLCAALLGSTVAYASSEVMTATEIMSVSQTTASTITRAQFCEMLVAASSRSGETFFFPTALFSDVKSDHPTNSAIRICVDEGWVSGYLNGSFRPDSAVTAAEGYLMVLRLMGYDVASMGGNTQLVVLNLAQELGLSDGISTLGALSGHDCATLFTNALNAKNPQGQVYATTLGYTLDANSAIDVSAVSADAIKGPYIYDGNLSITANCTIYRNDKRATSADLAIDDVYYLSQSGTTIYAYSDRVYGTIDSISPSLLAPTAVVVNGVSYQVGTSEARAQLSLTGGTRAGDMVTLLLGMDGDVVRIVDGVGGEVYYFGLVQSVATTLTGEDVSLFCTDGVTRSFSVLSTSCEAGDFAEVAIDDSISISRMSTRSLSGTVKNGALGGYDFADTIEILSVLDQKSAVVTAAEIDGYTFTSSQVLGYNLDNNGDISHLIIENVAGDLSTYGYATSVNEVNQSMTLNGTYTVMTDGKSTTIKSSNTIYNVDAGGVEIKYTSGAVSNINNLERVTIESLSGLTAYTSTDDTLLLAADVQIYTSLNDGYTALTLSDLLTGDYDMYGYVDGDTNGGKIRIILAR